ncbi:monooxygenase 2-like [Aristolochia californica]|uniref:monooxygenase 2-like n=1 Tax=Aristolochia californica TaxID=171875 RepID=UPI0035D64EA0
MVEICEDVVIVGGGIAGLATALALKKIGVRSLILERFHELRTTGTGINLFPNAWRALDALGVAHKLYPLYSSLTKAYFTDVATGETRVVPLNADQGNDKSELEARMVHRKALLEVLAEELPPQAIRFSAKLASIKMETVDGSSIIVLQLEEGTIIKAKAVIGCDGLHSVIAQWLGLSPPVSSGRSAVRGLSVYPDGHGFTDGAHQFLAPGARAGIVPLNATEIFWFITHMGEESSRDPELIKELVIQKKAKGFPQKYLDVVEQSVMESLTLDPLKLRLPWNLILQQAHKGNVTVAGDAMHPMTPDLGQGGCQALEDAVVLGQNIGKLRQADGSIEWEKVGEALGDYVKQRRWRVAGVTAGSYFMGRAQMGATGWLARFGWLTKFFRNNILFTLVFRRLLGIVNYDCGKLPEVPASSRGSKLE